LKFEWSEDKNRLNIQNHQLDFEEAKEVFDDPLHISRLDFRFDYFEERWITLGLTNKQKILVVANLFFDENGEEIIRIISARKANPKERKFYTLKEYPVSNIKDREKHDDFELKDDYDFSDGVRGRFYKPKKIPTTLRLDNDIILYFKKRASEEKVPYQTLINALLRKELQSV